MADKLPNPLGQPDNLHWQAAQGWFEPGNQPAWGGLLGFAVALTLGKCHSTTEIIAHLIEP